MPQMTDIRMNNTQPRRLTSGSLRSARRGIERYKIPPFPHDHYSHFEDNTTPYHRHLLKCARQGSRLSGLPQHTAGLGDQRTTGECVLSGEQLRMRGADSLDHELVREVVELAVLVQELHVPAAV